MCGKVGIINVKLMFSLMSIKLHIEIVFILLLSRLLQRTGKAELGRLRGKEPAGNGK
jgi:hypothetical protein